MITISEEVNNSKIDSDINFLKSFHLFTKQNNWRVVVSGGYGLDGYLRTITRTHGDLDLIIYGQDNRKNAEQKIREQLETQLKGANISTDSVEFFIEIDVHASKCVGNFYYVETVNNPMTDLSQVKKMDGQVVTNSPSDFPPPVLGKLRDLEIEVQDQGAHLKDILRRRGYDTALGKHDQDIKNIHVALRKTAS
jgi:hypothetical protein